MAGIDITSMLPFLMAMNGKPQNGGMNIQDLLKMMQSPEASSPSESANGNQFSNMMPLLLNMMMSNGKPTATPPQSPSQTIPSPSATIPPELLLNFLKSRK